MDVNPVHPLNVLLKLVTFAVFNPVKSRLVNDVSPANIPPIVVTLLVSHSDISTEVNAGHSLIIPKVEVQADCTKLSIPFIDFSFVQ